MEKIRSKKGIQLNQAFGAVLTLVLLGVLVIVALVLFSSLQTATLTPNTRDRVINESGAYLNSSNAGGYDLANANATGFANPAINQIINVTGAKIVGNYTLTSAGILLNSTNVNDTNYPDGINNLKVDYNYTWSATSSASNSTGTMITNFSGYPALVGLVGTIIFLGIVIGVLVASFVFGGKSQA